MRTAIQRDTALVRALLYTGMEVGVRLACIV